MDKKSIALTFFTAANGMQHQIVMSVALLDENSKSQEKILIYSTHWCCETIQGFQAALGASSRYQASGYFCPEQRVLQPGSLLLKVPPKVRKKAACTNYHCCSTVAETLIRTYVSYMYISSHHNYSSEFLVS